MPFIRLSDNYIDHPKIEPLSDGAFRLWHEMLAYSRRHQTDGLVPRTTLLGLRSYKSKRLDELMSDTRNGLPIIPLIAKVDGFGFKLHDYLQWNPSKDEENDRRAEAKARMRDTRERRKEVGDVPVFARTNCERSPTLSVRTSQDVLDRREKGISDQEKKSGEKPDVSMRAGRLLERYTELFTELRRGAKTRLTHNAIEFNEACDLCKTWDDARLEKLMRIVLTTDEPFIAGSDRSFRIFAVKASWADGRLTEAERRPA
jgi:hypothetical protein